MIALSLHKRDAPFRSCDIAVSGNRSHYRAHHFYHLLTPIRCLANKQDPQGTHNPKSHGRAEKMPPNHPQCMNEPFTVFIFKHTDNSF